MDWTVRAWAELTLMPLMFVLQFAQSSCIKEKNILQNCKKKKKK